MLGNKVIITGSDTEVGVMKRSERSLVVYMAFVYFVALLSALSLLIWR